MTSAWPQSTGGPTGEHFDRLIKVLEEIRDRLPEPDPPIEEGLVVLRGYALGQDAPPTASQVAVARLLVERPYLILDHRRAPVLKIAREIVARASAEGR